MPNQRSFAQGLARLMSCGIVWFELGLMAILRVCLMGMRGISRILNVEPGRADKDIMFIESMGMIVIFILMLSSYAAIFSFMGRLFQGADIQGAAMETVSMAVRDGFGTRQDAFGTVL